MVRERMARWACGPGQLPPAKFPAHVYLAPAKPHGHRDRQWRLALHCIFANARCKTAHARMQFVPGRGPAHGSDLVSSSHADDGYQVCPKPGI